jgi:hypothetical protein
MLLASGGGAEHAQGVARTSRSTYLMTSMGTSLITSTGTCTIFGTSTRTSLITSCDAQTEQQRRVGASAHHARALTDVP